jgi:hypothetical protein
MCCATTKVDPWPPTEPLIDLRICVAARFEVGEPRTTALVAIIGVSVAYSFKIV